MTRKPAEVVPAALPIHDALRANASLARLRERLDESHRRFAAIQDLLPAPLAAQVAPGPLDDEGWTLLAANASAAAKLRQLQPRLDQRLIERGWLVGGDPGARAGALIVGAGAGARNQPRLDAPLSPIDRTDVNALQMNVFGISPTDDEDRGSLSRLRASG